MQLKNNILNKINLIRNYFLINFCVSLSITLLMIGILKFKVNFIHSPYTVYIVASILMFSVWFSRLPEDNKIRGISKNIIAVCLIFLTALNLLNIFYSKELLTLFISLLLILTIIDNGFHENNPEKEPSFKKNDFSSKNSAYFLIIICLLTFLIRLYVGIKTNVDLDEGQLVYDAHLLKNGLILFKDFTSRSPFLLWLLVLIEKIRGSFGIINAKILISILYSIGGIFIYYISRQLNLSKRKSIFLLIFIILFPLLFYYSVVLHVGQSFVPPLLISIYIFIQYLKKQDRKYLVFCSILLAVTYLIRGEVITYIPVFILFLIQKKNYKKTIVDICLFSLVGLCSYIILSIPIIKNIGFVNYDKYYGLESLITQSSKPVALVSSTKYFIISSWFIIVAPFLYIFLLRINGLIFQARKEFLRYGKIVSSGIFFIIFTFFTFQYSSGKTGGYTLFYSNYFVAYLVFYSFLIYYIHKNSVEIYDFKNKIDTRIELFLMLQVIFPLFVIVSRLNDIHPNYFLATTVLILILTLSPFIRLFKSIYKNNRHIGIVFIFLGCLMFIKLNIEFFTTKTHERGYSHTLLKAVSDSVDQFSTKQERIFTVDTTLVIDADREITPPITHHTIYFDNTDNWNLSLPTINNISAVLEQEKVELIIVGFRTNDLINLSDNLGNYINDNYVIIDTIEIDGQKIDIYRRIKS